MQRWKRNSLILGLPMLGIFCLVESVAEPGKPLKQVHKAVDDLISLVADTKPNIFLPRHPQSKGHMAIRKRTAAEKLADARDGDKHLRWTSIFAGVYDGNKEWGDAPQWSFNYYVAQRPMPPMFFTYDDPVESGGSEGGVNADCAKKLSDGLCATPCALTDILCDENKKNDPMIAGGSSLPTIPDEKIGSPPIISDPIVSGGIGGGAGGGVGGLGAPVPEPSTWVMLVIGFSLLAFFGARYKHV